MKNWFVLSIYRLCARLSPRMVRRLGGLVGRLYFWIPNRERHNARINIALCFPEWSEAQRRALLKRSLIENVTTMIEMPAIWCGNLERWLSLVREETGRESLEQAVQQGRGVVLAGPHLGSWELCGLMLGRIAPLTTLYRPPRYEVMEALMVQGRSRTHARLVPTDAGGVKALYQALQRGEMVAILPDQQPKSERGSVFAPFFGEPALTMELVSRLSRKTGAPVVFCFVERLSAEAGYRLHWLAAPEGIDDADPVIAATALNRGVETCVRRCPEQYQWTYKRFRARPDGGPNRYAGSR